MKKKIKDLTMKEFADFCESHLTCEDCPLGNYKKYECDIHFRSSMLNVEVEIDE